MLASCTVICQCLLCYRDRVTLTWDTGIDFTCPRNLLDGMMRLEDFEFPLRAAVTEYDRVIVNIYHCEYLVGSEASCTSLLSALCGG